MIKLKSIISEVKKSEEKKDTFESFAETRMGGAEKISNNAHEKGGLSLLTWHHFKVKLPYYKKASEGKLDVEKMKSEYKELLEKFYKSTKGDMNITQIQFQELLGKLEVLGELIIKYPY
jgi:hypothetical protein